MIQDIAPHKFNNAYRPDAAPRPSDPVFHFRGRDVAVRDAGGLDDRRVVAHVVDDADEAVVEDLEGLAQDGVEGGGGGAGEGVHE